ncbi:MAG: hypothetical protein AB8H86_33485 [Polyangiales bacterium]
MNDNQPSSTRSARRVFDEEGEAASEAIGDLFRVGRMWALHGLRVAELALQTSAETLRVTASAMGNGARRISEELDAE